MGALQYTLVKAALGRNLTTVARYMFWDLVDRLHRRTNVLTKKESDE
jgi:hypothetical protein